MSENLYFDHAASAPRRPEVLAAMEPWMSGVVGNPAGSHADARRARRAIEEAREVVAEFVGVDPTGVIFTGSGTESCHLALAGVVQRHRHEHEHTELIVSAVEHHAVLASAELLASTFDDVTLSIVKVDSDGVVDLDQLQGMLNEDCALVSVMTANNETGVDQPMGAISGICNSMVPGGTPTHTDAIAAAAWQHLPTVTATFDLISICAHKLGGPVNSGALVMRNPVPMDAVMPGGAQERGFRGGTIDVAAAVGLAAACAASERDRITMADRCEEFQTQLVSAFSLIKGVAVTARGARRLPGHVHVTVEGVASDELLFLLDQEGVRASAAAACSSGATASSHVLQAMGIAPELARGALRFTMGAETSKSDVDELIRIFAKTVHHLRPPA
jgi:cysteine desulfurase